MSKKKKKPPLSDFSDLAMVMRNHFFEWPYVPPLITGLFVSTTCPYHGSIASRSSSVGSSYSGQSLDINILFVVNLLPMLTLATANNLQLLFNIDPVPGSWTPQVTQSDQYMIYVKNCATNIPLENVSR